jgi:protein required for attachment to host cells
MSGGPVWVATFDGQLARVYAVDEQKRLRALDAEGLDARENSDDQPDGLRLPHTGSPTREHEFVTHFAEQLDRRLGAGAFGTLIVSADPTALSYFRQYAPARLKEAVKAEINKDHVHTPVKAFEAAISQHLEAKTN